MMAAEKIKTAVTFFATKYRNLSGDQPLGVGDKERGSSCLSFWYNSDFRFAFSTGGLGRRRYLAIAFW